MENEMALSIAKSAIRRVNDCMYNADLYPRDAEYWKACAAQEVNSFASFVMCVAPQYCNEATLGELILIKNQLEERGIKAL